MRKICVPDNYFSVGANFVLAFELRPQYLTGLLFHVQSNKTSLSVFLIEKTVNHCIQKFQIQKIQKKKQQYVTKRIFHKVGVKMNDGRGVVSVTVRPRQSLCDERFHVVTGMISFQTWRNLIKSHSSNCEILLYFSIQTT